MKYEMDHIYFALVMLRGVGADGRLCCEFLALSGLTLPRFGGLGCLTKLK